MLFASLKSLPSEIPSEIDAVELRLDLNPSLKTAIPHIKKPIIIKSHDPSDVSLGEYYDCDWQDTPPEGAKIICSRHMDHTPDDLFATFTELMKTMPAHYYKLATTAHSTLDALRMLIATRKLQAQGHPVIGLCMGELGQITRIASSITYAHLGDPTADGQLHARELIDIYRFPRHDKRWYGLIGDPIAQSFSHIAHNPHCFFMKMRIRPDELDTFFQLVEQLPFHGLAVTIPHKLAVKKYCESDMPAVNTLVRDTHWKGYNTDGPGALNLLEPIENKRIALLGAGGAAIGIAYEALKRKAVLAIYNRTPKTILGIATQSLDQLQPYDILINATSCGMLCDDCPIRRDQLLPRTTVLETICTPEETTLIRFAKAKNCNILHGKDMFESQAQLQYAHWEIQAS